MLTDLRAVEESKRMLIKAKTAKAATNAKLTISTLEMMLSSTIAGESREFTCRDAILDRTILGAATTIATNPIWLIQTHQATRGAVETVSSLLIRFLR